MDKMLKVGSENLEIGKQTYIMGIINLTPDSFSGDGILSQNNHVGYILDKALSQGRQFIELGAHILDIGAESTRPGSAPVSEEEELERILPVAKLLVEELDVFVSVDTYKAKVAEEVLKVGVHIINDVWGLHADPELAGVAAKYDATVVLMHNRSSWANAEIKSRLGGRYVGVPYQNLIEEIKAELLDSVSIAESAGVLPEKIILDPGIGFGKTVEQNLSLLNRLSEIRDLGYPILLGPSRKSFIGYTLDLPVDQRIEGTAAAVAVGIDRGADIIRVHDVEFMTRVAKMTDAIVRQKY